MHKHSSHCTRGMTVEERLLHYLPNRPDEECWLWEGTTNRRGYGIITLPGKRQKRAHRLAYETWVGPIPEGLTLDHVKARGCTSTLCCNPEHLEPVTAAENVRRGEGPPMRNSRKTHCVNGHALEGDNLVPRRIGDKVYRDCLTCRRERGRKYDARRPRKKD